MSITNKTGTHVNHATNAFAGRLIPKGFIHMGVVFHAVGEGYGVVYRDIADGEIMEAHGVDGSRYVFITSDDDENMYQCFKRESRKAHLARLSPAEKVAYTANEQRNIKGEFPTETCSHDVDEVHVLGFVTFVPMPTLGGEVSTEEAGELLGKYLHDNGIIEESSVVDFRASEKRAGFRVIS